MALQLSQFRRFAAWCTDSSIANVRTNNRSYSWWFKCTSSPLSSWGFNVLGWFSDNYPFVPGGADAMARLVMQRYGSATGGILLRAYHTANQVYGNADLSTVTADVWHNVIMVCGSTDLKFAVYLDNVLIGTGLDMTPNNTINFVLGGCARNIPSLPDKSVYETGSNVLLADLLVYNGVLTSGDRALIYAAGAPAYNRETSTSIGTSITPLLRFPMSDSLRDVVSGNLLFGSTLRPIFADDTDLFSSQSTANSIPVNTNPGVATRYLFGPTPKARIIRLGDSFGSVSSARINANLANKLSGGTLGTFYWSTPRATTATNNGTLYDVASANGYRVENNAATARTITGKSYSAGVLTLTYDGPNLLPGQTVRLGSTSVSVGTFWKIDTFTAGTGTGVDQDGAIVTITTSDPGNIVADTLVATLPLPGQYTEWYDGSGTSTGIIEITADPIGESTANQSMGVGGALNKFSCDWYAMRGAKLRIYHRFASDINIQAKSVRIYPQTNQQADDATKLVTPTGLADDATKAGQIAVLAEVDFGDLQERAGAQGVTSYRFKIKTTGTAADTQGRYLCILGCEIVFPSSSGGLSWINLDEASWGQKEIGAAVAGYKAMDQLTWNAIAKGLVDADPSRRNIVTVNMDVDQYTIAQYLANYQASKLVIDAAFAAAGSSCVYLIEGMYVHEQNSGTTMALTRQWVENQNIAAKQFAEAHPSQVEFVSMYAISEGEYLCGGEFATPGIPAPCFGNEGAPQGPFQDGRVMPFLLPITDATWTNGTLTITKTNGFTNICTGPLNSTYRPMYVFVMPTSKTGTPVVTGWYQIASITASTIVTTATISGGSAGVGADVKVMAVWQNNFGGLHLSGYGGAVAADWLMSAIYRGLQLPVIPPIGQIRRPGIRAM